MGFPEIRNGNSCGDGVAAGGFQPGLQLGLLNYTVLLPHGVAGAGQRRKKAGQPALAVAAASSLPPG